MRSYAGSSQQSDCLDPALCHSIHIECPAPAEKLMVEGVDFIGKGIDILELGSGDKMSALRSHVSSQTGDVAGFVARQQQSQAAVARLQGGRTGRERKCIPSHENPMLVAGKLNHVTDYISFTKGGDATAETKTTKVNSVSELVTERTSSFGIDASAILPKGLVGSVGYSSDEVTKTRSTFTLDSTAYYSTATVTYYQLNLNERHAEANFKDAVGKLPASCPADTTTESISHDGFVNQFGTHFITGLTMGGSMKLTSQHTYPTCTRFSTTQVEKCVDAALTDRVGAAVQQAGQVTGQDIQASNAASAENCPTDTSSSQSSTDAETIVRKTHFVGGHPREYLDLNLGLVDRLFCYSKWIEDISTTPAPIKYTLEGIEYAVDRVDPTKASCIKDAVARHIRDVYTESSSTATTANAEPPTCDSGAVVPAPGQALLAAVAGVLAVLAVVP